MKKLHLRQSANKNLLAQFQKNLQQINYSKDTVYNANSSVKEYLFYLELNQINLFDTKDLNPYFEYLKTRSNQRTDGGLSMAYLHKHLAFLKLFYVFLERKKSIREPIFPKLVKSKSQPKMLSVQEVEQLFKSCDQTLLGKRNKAVLAIYYGLGLRRKEGVQLKIEDINFSKEEVFIAQSKTHRQRIVPMSDHVKTILEDYIFNVREKLVPKDKSTSSVLVTERGKALAAESVSYVIRKLIKDAKIKKQASAHTLRHSIATHLLQSGMKLESIALFLGHRSLDSTQIYTHLVEGRHPKNEKDKPMREHQD
ncbi:MAG: tyrosine-type recombinase/integrase [Crocinitomicaceae bacterium]|nr:tyrosine-type recombinase/integrase [Crocinitomicaceae bacterium]